MWLDTDLIFLNDNWVPETAALLDEYSVVQPFGWMTYLPASAGGDGSGYVAKLGQLPLGMGVGAVYHSAGLGVSTFGDSAFSSSFLLGHPGFAWAARREGGASTVALNRYHAPTYERQARGDGLRLLRPFHHRRRGPHHARCLHGALRRGAQKVLAEDGQARRGGKEGRISSDTPTTRPRLAPSLLRHVVDHGRSISALVGPANISCSPRAAPQTWARGGSSHGQL